jgi:hypothetical protein
MLLRLTTLRNAAQGPRGKGAAARRSAAASRSRVRAALPRPRARARARSTLPAPLARPGSVKDSEDDADTRLMGTSMSLESLAVHAPTTRLENSSLPDLTTP